MFWRGKAFGNVEQSLCGRKKAKRFVSPVFWDVGKRMGNYLLLYSRFRQAGRGPLVGNPLGITRKNESRPRHTRPAVPWGNGLSIQGNAWGVALKV